MTNKLSLDALWASVPVSESTFQPGQLSGFPEPVRRYLEHAIAPGTLLASAVRLWMHGEIKLRRWFPFHAEQVIHRDRGMIWSATVRWHGLPIRGSDRLVDGVAAMRWKLLGLIPVITASGPDITRSAAGRVQAELIWLPSTLCGAGILWSVTDSAHLRAVFTAQGNTAELAFAVDDKGRLKAVKLPRWGNPEGTEFHHVDFGAVMEAEKTFHGYTIPTHLRVGWYFGTDRFETEGEFFRVTIDDAAYR